MVLHKLLSMREKGEHHDVRSTRKDTKQHTPNASEFAQSLADQLTADLEVIVEQTRPVKEEVVQK